MKILKWLYAIGIGSTMICACKDGAPQDEEKDKEGISVVLLDDANSEVSLMTLKQTGFSHELSSNGKVTACREAELRFESAKMVEEVFVKNGDRVRKGQKIAVLDTFELYNSLLQAKDALDRSKLDLQDVLIGQGYSVGQWNAVPDSVLKLSKVKSGYDQALFQYEVARRALRQATLVAPFDGVVANLFSKPYNLANTGEPFCTIIDMGHMETVFSVLESELSLIRPGDRVVVTPYSDSSAHFTGNVSEVNPWVDENGMVKVKALIDGKGKLFSGMNVRISVRRTLSQQLVIPKSAVVLRSGREVVFTYKDGKAIWNYVNIGLENSDSCVVSNKAEEGVTDGLLEGDQVIVTGNVNLAHEAPVKVSE